MEKSYKVKDSLSSEPFCIQGPLGAKFYVHKYLLAKHSSVFAAVVDQVMEEEAERHITITAVESDINDETVKRFVEFVYTEDPTAAERAVAHGYDKDRQVDSTLATDEKSSRKRKQATETSLEGCSRPTKRPNEDRPSKRQIPAGQMSVSPNQMWQDFTQAASIHPDTDPRHKLATSRYSLSISQGDLLNHVKLYVFSVRYDCRLLRIFSFDKIRSMLAYCNKPAEQTQHISPFIHYVYNYVQDEDLHSTRLRELVVTYIACHAEALLPTHCLHELLYKHQTFAADLLVKSRSRLGTGEET